MVFSVFIKNFTIFGITPQATISCRKQKSLKHNLWELFRSLFNDLDARSHPFIQKIAKTYSGSLQKFKSTNFSIVYLPMKFFYHILEAE